MESSKSNRRQQGFSLIEVVIASGILAISIASIMTLALYTQRNTRYLIEKSFAALKASDGIELVRQKRDTNLKDKDPSTDWDYGLDKSDIEKLNKTFNFANQSFEREVKVGVDCAPAPCKVIESIVSWPDGEVKIITQLTDWRLES
jgi:prepilin-type N-terminal cleavage/methylation domain-containing protein